MVSSSNHIAAGWLVAAVPEGLLFVGPDLAVEAELPRSLAEAVVTEAARSPLGPALAAAGIPASDREQLLGELSGLGALTDRPAPAAPSDTVPLIAALEAAEAGEILPERIVTADELLVVPPGTSGRHARRLLRAFVAGLASHDRLRAYGYAALTRRRTVVGDLPHPDVGPRLSEQSAVGGEVRVVDLGSGATERLELAGLDELGAARVHRLGTAVAARHADPPPPGAPAVHICMVRFAHPNLRHPGSGHGEATGIAESPDRAELIARAEAAERFACGDLTDRVMVRSAPERLDAPAVLPHDVIRRSPRQVAAGRATDGLDLSNRLWTVAATLDGHRRWVPAEMVYNPFLDPAAGERLPGLTSSGCAAYSDPGEARKRAIAELVERDAFMWHWVHRVSRERIQPSTLPDADRDQIAAMRAAGHAVDLVNLTLDTKPVVLCALRTSAGVLSIAASCRETAVDAAGRALREASTLLWSDPAAVSPVRDPTTVRLPLDHLGVYRDPSALEHAAFLWRGIDSIDVADVVGIDGPIERVVRAIGDPVIVDLTCPGSRPFSVVRALVPGLVPLTFGYDREPLGMPRLQEGISLADGRRLDVSRDPSSLDPLFPHPFP